MLFMKKPKKLIPIVFAMLFVAGVSLLTVMMSSSNLVFAKSYPSNNYFGYYFDSQNTDAVAICWGSDKNDCNTNGSSIPNFQIFAYFQGAAGTNQSDFQGGGGGTLQTFQIIVNNCNPSEGT